MGKYRKRLINHRGRHRREQSILTQLWNRLRYGRYRGIYCAVIWILFLLFVMPVFERVNQEFFQDVGYVLLIPSAIIGFYAAYPIIMWIDKRLSDSYFGVWMRRVVSSILVLAGLALSFSWLLAFLLTVVQLASRGGTIHGAVSATALSCTILAFFFGISFFAGYLEYVFERRSGVLVFTGHQRF